MSRSMQLNYIGITVFSETDLFLDRIYFEWDSRGSKKKDNQSQDTKSLLTSLRDWTGTAFLSEKKKGVLKIDQSVKMPGHAHRLLIQVWCSGNRMAPVGTKRKAEQYSLW